MRERFDAYRRKVVRRFHERHFARLDRQIVLVDLAGHVAAGQETVADVSASLDAVLRSLKIGEGWLPRWLVPRIERVLFAASKADHLPADQHAALAERLKTALDDSLRRTAYTGATLDTRTFAALRATTEVEAKGRHYVAGRTEDDAEAIAHYPGRIAPSAGAGGGFAVRRFLPPADLDPYSAWPHIRLDRGDRVPDRRLADVTGPPRPLRRRCPRQACPWAGSSALPSRRADRARPPRSTRWTVRTACRSATPGPPR